MIRRIILCVLTAGILVNICSCALLQKPLDRKTSFSKELGQLESNLRSEEWEQSGENLEAAKKAWKKLKPWLQIDIDHDYVNEIEESFVKLEAYIDTEDQPDALATVLLIQETWTDIGSL